MSERKSPVWRLPLPSWFRRGREGVNLSDVPVHKIQEAAENRGIRVGNLKVSGREVRGDVHKVIIMGNDEP